MSANDYENFALGQAKQFVPVTLNGDIVTDGILMREDTEKYTLSGVPASQSWVKYHGEKGGYNVRCVTDPGLRHSAGAARPCCFGSKFKARARSNWWSACSAVRCRRRSSFTRRRYPSAARISGLCVMACSARRAMNSSVPSRTANSWKNAILEAGKEFGLVSIGGLAYAT